MIKRFKKRQQDHRKFYRTNERIFASQLRVLDSDGKQIGILPKFEALKKARELELDLVEVAPKASPPVARIIDFKKFLYQEEKKRREEKKKAKVSETKEVRLGPFMNEHDLQVMARRAREFLGDGDKVRLVVRFSGRQITHPEFGHQVADKVIHQLSDIAKLERDKKFEGRQLIAFLSPDKKGKSSTAKAKEDETKHEEKSEEISSQALQSDQNRQGHV